MYQLFNFNSPCVIIEEPYDSKLLPRVTNAGTIVKTFNIKQSAPNVETENIRTSDHGRKSRAIRAAEETRADMKRKSKASNNFQTSKLKKRKEDHIEMLQLRHLNEGPKRKNRPSEFLETIKTLSATNIDHYTVGKRIFISGMPN
jgi:hypothetical protein